jgi:hypothetical protein
LAIERSQLRSAEIDFEQDDAGLLFLSESEGLDASTWEFCFLALRLDRSAVTVYTVRNSSDGYFFDSVNQLVRYLIDSCLHLCFLILSYCVYYVKRMVPDF